MARERLGPAIRQRKPHGERLFGACLSAEQRTLSDVHWTPLSVVSTVCEWVTRHQLATVVDMGSGAGKLCVALALASRCRVIGIEHRSELVAVARALAQQLGTTESVEFILGDLSSSPIPEADAYYLYNPFYENLVQPRYRIDDRVELSDQRYEKDVAAMVAFLEQRRVGTYVIVFHGFGAEMPEGYCLVERRYTKDGSVELWQRQSA